MRTKATCVAWCADVLWWLVTVTVYGFIVSVEETLLQANILTPSQFRELPRHGDYADSVTVISWLMDRDLMQVPR